MAQQPARRAGALAARRAGALAARRAGALAARRAGALAAATAFALTGCTLVSGTGDGGQDTVGAPDQGGTVVLVTHNSFALPDELVAAFEQETGLTLQVSALGDAGTMVNQLVLTKDDPVGDVVFGIDNTFASRAVDAGVLAPSTTALPPGAEQYLVGDSGLVPVDVGDVCVNADLRWFDERGLDLPATLEDLADPAYRGLLVVQNPATSSPGLAFALATIGAFGEDGWLGYWQRLVDNDVQVAASWEDAYYAGFSGPSSEGDRPLVVSYASSPPFEVGEGEGEAPTAALLETCFRQVEYAGVLAGADNPTGAQQVLDWLLSAEVQAAIPEHMYVYPVDDSVPLPQAWAQFAPPAPSPFTVDPADVAANRDAWIQDWTATVVG